jgi:hypothetical protein
LSLKFVCNIEVVLQLRKAPQRHCLGSLNLSSVHHRRPLHPKLRQFDISQIYMEANQLLYFHDMCRLEHYIIF